MKRVAIISGKNKEGQKLSLAVEYQGEITEDHTLELHTKCFRAVVEEGEALVRQQLGVPASKVKTTRKNGRPV